MPQSSAGTEARSLPGAAGAESVTVPSAKKRSEVVAVVLTACAIVIGGCLFSILCSALSAWLTGSGYVVAPGPPL